MTIDEAKKTIKPGMRFRFSKWSIWVVVSLQRRGPVIELENGGHKTLVEWSRFSAPNFEVV